MSRLEKRKYDPLAGTGQWASKRTGQLLDAASRMVTSHRLIAPGCHWSIPALRGVPTEYQFFGGLNAAGGQAVSLRRMCGSELAGTRSGSSSRP